MKRTAPLLALLLAGCLSSVPRPSVLGSAEEARLSPAVKDAEQRAPQTHARALSLHRRAELAHAAGDSASAQILAEHALATYERAVVLSRLATAEARRGDAEARVLEAEQQLSALTEQQKRVLAETEQLELRARVIRDTLPLPSNAPASPARERARLEAARSLALHARLLCVSARLLAPERAPLDGLFAQIEELDIRLSKRILPAPIDDATRLRSHCLSELTKVRRPKTLAEPAAGGPDRLLEQLSKAAYAPVRDDRGVVVTLREVFTQPSALSSPAHESLQALGRVAIENPQFPVLLVLHSARGSQVDRDQQRLEAAAQILRAAGAQRIETTLGGDAAPNVDPARPGAESRNERLEIVFVAPNSS